MHYMHYKEKIMDLKPGDVVMLKSGGHPLSVVEVKDGNVACVWMGNEGDLFRETLPLAVLDLAEPLGSRSSGTPRAATASRAHSGTPRSTGSRPWCASASSTRCASRECSST